MENKISNIDGINAMENGTMFIFLKNGDKIEVDSISFNDDGTFELGYIYD